MSFLDATGLGTFWGKLKNYFVSKNNFYTDIPDGLCHNSIYREKDITADYLSGKVSTNIANGTFHDIFPGDRITLNNRTYVVGGLNTYLNKGESASGGELTTNHLLMFPLTHLGSEVMNSTATVTGAYKGSELYTKLHSTSTGSYYEIVAGDFGSSHLIQHSARLCSAVTSIRGAMYYQEGKDARSSNWAWSAEYLSLMSEVQVYGCFMLGSSYYDIGEADSQIPAFRLNPRLVFNRGFWWWLRGVASSTRFCAAGNAGVPIYSEANTESKVRPMFLII